MILNLADPHVEELHARIRGGLRWKLFSETAILVSRVAVAVALARLLTPRDFGIAAMVLLLSNLVVSFADIGVGSALVQRRTIDDRDRSTMFWLSLGAGLLFTIIGIALAFAVADFYGEPTVIPLFIVFSFAFVLTSLGATQRTLLYRAMDFRRLELRAVAGVVAGVLVAIGIALLGFGPWALIGQSLTVVAVSTLLLWLLVPWRPTFVFDASVARQLGVFGLRSVGASLFTISTTIVDKLLVGRVLGAGALGVYSLAFNTVLMPLTRIVVPIAQVFYPAIARQQDDYDALGATWVRMNRAVVAVFAPLTLGILVAAPDFVPAVFGNRWNEAVPVLQVLAWGTLFQALQTLNPSVLQAVNRPATALRFSILTLVVSVGAYSVGLVWGVVGVAAGFAVANTVLAIGYAVLTARVIGLPLATFLRSHIGVTQAAVVMVAVMVGVRELLLHSVDSHWIRLVAVLLCGAAAYVPALFWRAPEVVSDVRLLLPRAASGNDAPAV